MLTIDANDFANQNAGITPNLFSSCEWMKRISLRVPLYQRLFVWEEEQVCQLLNDLWYAYKNEAEKPYYIGILTVYRDQKTSDADTWDLVDGQQRMTVLTLLGIACLKKWGIAESPWPAFLEKEDGHGSRLCYFARKQDQKDLENLRRNGNLDTAVASIKNINMRRFFEAFDRFVVTKNEDVCQWKAFSQFVYEKTTALVSFLPDTYGLDDLNFYFEKMNAAGKQLEAHEILKGKYFGRYGAKWNALADGSRRYSIKEERTEDDKDDKERDPEYTLEDLLKNPIPYEEPTGTVLESTRLVMSFPVFLLHVLSICLNQKNPTNDDLDPRKLLSIFEKEKNSWDVNTFILEMEKYRMWMDEQIIHIEDDRPVSPYLTKTDEPYSDAYKNSKWQFQSMLYVSGGEVQKWVLEAYLVSPAKPLREDTLFVMLKELDNERHSFNKNIDFSYGGIDRYWFWKLDYILWEKVFDGYQKNNQESERVLGFKQDQVAAIKAYIFRRNRSIEHLHPQNPPPPEGDKWKGTLHYFGNLAMISASFNSQQSNDTVGTKFGRMKDKIDRKELESIKLLLMFNAADGIDSKWTTDVAEKHKEAMMELLEKYYTCIGSEYKNVSPEAKVLPCSAF